MSSRRSSPLHTLFYGGDETLEDGSRYNPQVMSFIRDEWIYEQMQQRCVGTVGRGERRRV